MYAQSSKFSHPSSLPNAPNHSSEEPSQTGTEMMVVEQPYVGTWRPYVGSSPSRTPSLMNKNSLTVWNQLDYPFGDDLIFCKTLFMKMVLIVFLRA